MTEQNKNSLFEQINKIMENPESFRVSDCLPIIIKLEAIIGMQKAAFEEINQISPFDSDDMYELAKKTLKESDKMMNGGEDE